MPVLIFPKYFLMDRYLLACRQGATAMDLATKTAALTTEQIKANIEKIYYQLVVGEKQLGSIQANIDRFEKLLHDTKEIYKNGFAEKLDVDKVQVQLNNLILKNKK